MGSRTAFLWRGYLTFCLGSSLRSGSAKVKLGFHPNPTKRRALEPIL